MRVAFFTLGCKVNQYETEVMKSIFASQGFDIVSVSDEADLYVINSCTVTAAGDKKTRQALRRFKREHPGAKTALTGCFPQAFPDVAQKIPEADIITGSYNRKSLVQLVKQSFNENRRIVEVNPHKKGEDFEEMRIQRFAERTRAFVKIQDGCDRYCSFCIIPTARGFVRSKTLPKLREELEQLAQNGYQEVVLVGINLSSFGKERGEHLLDAVETACSVEGIQRVRLGSLEPELLTKEDIQRLAEQEKFCPQFHLSLQSGCDATLKRMFRHYDTKEYKRIVDDIRTAFKNPAITTDIMVGFPGETDEEFQQSLAFAKDIGFAKMHVFAYSVRQGTRAARFDNQITQIVKDKRSREMAVLEKRMRQIFLEQQINRQETVLFENCNGHENHGYTKNYTPVFVQSQEDLSGQILEVSIVDAHQEQCTGELLKAYNKAMHI